MRVMLPNGKNAWLIGDPHLGRKFETGVPLHRRGEREASQFAKFKAELATPCDYNVMVGDLTDHPYVSHGVIVQAAEAYLEAARENPDTVFLAMAGNHDLPRNIKVTAAWDVFEQIVNGRLENLHATREPMNHGDLTLFPWDWSTSATAQVLQHDRINPVVIGHWDLKSYGGDDSHMAPVAALPDYAVLYSGHYHVPGLYEVGGRIVHCTGSLEPYSHGEDPDGEIYVTLSLAEATDGRDLSQKCVRITLADGEELPTDLDCLALTSIKQASEYIEDNELVVSTFDWSAILNRELEPLDQEVRGFIEERLNT